MRRGRLSASVSYPLDQRRAVVLDITPSVSRARCTAHVGGRCAVLACGTLHIAVVGSVNLDLVASCPRLPLPGETLGGATFARHPGGKGANQALAARRMGADVALTACVGSDAFADEALVLLGAAGVDIGACRRHPHLPTGVALILVAADGENQIVVVPGANEALAPVDVAVAAADGVVCQLEIPLDVVEAAAERAEGLFCLNAAPYRPLPAKVIRRADLVVVNEVEWRSLGDSLAECPGLVALTLGAAGARLYRHGEEVAAARPPPVHAVDTVGAGDAFCGALVVSLIQGKSEQDSLARACTAGALAASRPGAQPALPVADEVDALLSP